MSISAALERLATRLDARIGRAGLQTTNAEDFPARTVTTTADVQSASAEYDVYPVYTRTVAIESKVDAPDDDYQNAMDAEMIAIRAILAAEADSDAPLNGNALAVRDRGAQYFHPGAGSNMAAVQITAEIDYTTR